ncbi:hypothetical protein ACFQ60_41710 [Streptomyces zhihengii]
MLPLDTVHRVRRASGGTANDVLLAVVAGALGRWMTERGDRLPAAGPRALVPVSRRRPGQPAGSGNRLSAYLLELPVAEPDPGCGWRPCGRRWTATRPPDRPAAPAPWPCSPTSSRPWPTASGRRSPAAPRGCSSTSW